MHTDSLSIGSNLRMIIGQTKPWQGRIDVICFLVQVGWREGGVGGRIPKSSLRTGDGLRLRPQCDPNTSPMIHTSTSTLAGPNKQGTNSGSLLPRDGTSTSSTTSCLG